MRRRAQQQQRGKKSPAGLRSWNLQSLEKSRPEKMKRLSSECGIIIG